MKTNYLKILPLLALVFVLVHTTNAQRNGHHVLFNPKFFPVFDTSHHFTPDTSWVRRDTTHHWLPDTTKWVRDTTHHWTPDTTKWVIDTTHHWTPWVMDTTHHWTPDTTVWVRDTIHHWVPDTTHHWIPDTTHHWVPDSTHHWIPDSTFSFKKDSIHHWTPDSTHLNRKLMRVRSSIYPNPSLSGEASITIDAPATDTFTLNVYNTGGILISTQSVTGGTTLLSILTSGFYYYQVINSSGIKVSGGIIVVSQ